MKKEILSFTLLALLLAGVTVTHAQTETPAVTGTSSPSANVKEDPDVKLLKEKVANKVAELRKQDQTAKSGTVVSVKDGSVIISTVEDSDQKQYTITVDGTLTKLYRIVGATKKEIKIGDIKPDNYVIASGPVADTNIQANVVYVDDPYIVQSGKITEVNKTDYYIKVMTSDKTEYTLDIESSTKQFLMNIKTLEVERTGFSKIKEGDIMHFSAVKTVSEKDKNRYAAGKILIVPQEYFLK